MELVAHRGCITKKYQNTLRGFTKGWYKYNICECDTWYYKGEWILTHDEPEEGVKYDTLSSALSLASRIGKRLIVEFKQSTLLGDPPPLKGVVDLVMGFDADYLIEAFGDTEGVLVGKLLDEGEPMECLDGYDVIYMHHGSFRDGLQKSRKYGIWGGGIPEGVTSVPDYLNVNVTC